MLLFNILGWQYGDNFVHILLAIPPHVPKFLLKISRNIILTLLTAIKKSNLSNKVVGNRDSHVPSKAAFT